MSSRYEPCRRAIGEYDARVTRAGSHRQIKQRSRVGLFAVALSITVLVGAAAVGVLPRLQGMQPASANAAPSTFETAELAAVVAPVPAPAAKEEKDLAATVADKNDALPQKSGTGKRVVFSESEQRVWLVDSGGTVDRTYKVSGSIHDNLDPGTYAVQSQTRHATSYDYGSTMEYFVRFTSGRNAPIGFHDIPVANDGKLLQTKAQLGTPLSSGCIRQERPDAIKLWEFAQVGTTVVVLA